jgi:hypothetical protein
MGRPKSTRVCSMPECTRKHFAKDVCRKHYWYVLRGVPPRTPPRGIPAFWLRVDKTDMRIKSPHVSTPCWEWTGSTVDGYGSLKFAGRAQRAHRVSWQIVHGPIPPGEDLGPHGTCVLHTCDNRRCVRPDHLFLGSNKDNTHDKIAKGRSNHAVGDASGARTCPDAYPRGEAHCLAKLTDPQVRDIRARYSKGRVSQQSLATEYGVSQVVVSAIVRRKTWKHIA